VNNDNPDYDDTMSVDGEEIDFGIREEERTVYVAHCEYNGVLLETDEEDSESSAEWELKRLIQEQRAEMRKEEMRKLERWNAGLPLSGIRP
jgi:hypothetical protein